jgi:dTDP-4-amino-4,6-dideoxygalactose transaminase
MGSFKDETRALAGGIAPTYPTTLAALPEMRRRKQSGEEEWPGAESLVRELVTLPVHSRMSPREIEANIRLVLESFRN